MKIVLSNKKVVQIVTFALQKKMWKRNYQYSIIVSFNKSTLKCFCSYHRLSVFFVRIRVFLVYHLGSFEITEGESIKRGAVSITSFQSL